MPTIIAIHGPIASGKSSLCAEFLERHKDFAYVSRSRYKARYRWMGKRLSRFFTNRAVRSKVHALARQRRDILVSEQAIDKLVKTCPLGGYRTFGFYLKPPLDVMLARNSLREQPSSLPHIKYVFEKSSPCASDIIIDTSRMTVFASIKFIEQKIREPRQSY